MENEKNMKKEERRGIFLGIVGVLTLIVAIIGASFAYFSINARSNENAVKVKAATVQVVFENGSDVNVNGIIPSTLEVAKWASEREGDNKCLDSNGRIVCAVYEFGVVNTGDELPEFQFSIKPNNSMFEVEEESEETLDVNHFENLKYILYDTTKEDLSSDPKVTATQIGTEIEGYKLSDWDSTNNKYKDIELDAALNFNDANDVASGQEKTYRLFIWLNAATDEEGTEIAQDSEQGAEFSGTIYIDFGESGIITGAGE